LIKLQDIVKSYQMGKNSLTVLKGINLDIQDGEMVAIMGPSGSGKTTLLNLIGCLDKATSGKYYFGDKDVSNFTGNELAELRGQKIGFIFQTFNLLSKLSALANVEMGMMYSGGVNRERAKEALEKVGLAERINHRPIELSGGEQQRVAIARALVKNPSVFLADEPTGQLDSHSGREIMSILANLQAEHHITVLVVTHDSSIANQCQRIIRLKDGEIVTEDKE
jgi:putative ABC transport system ATP-binding protein